MLGRGHEMINSYGVSVRLVTDVSAAPTPTEPEYVEMNMGTGAGAYTRKWATKNLEAETVAGSGVDTSLYDAGSSGSYWSSSWYGSTHAYYLIFGSDNVKPQYSNYRYGGFSVRPVSDL